MKQFIVGAIIGSCLTLAIVAVYGRYTPDNHTNSPVLPKEDGIRQTTRQKPQEQHTRPGKASMSATEPRPAAESPGATDERDITDFLIREVRALEQQNANETFSAIDDLSGLYSGQSRSQRRALRNRVEELKSRGREIVPDLIDILNGSASDMSKVIAANVLGAINAELQDPEISGILNSNVVPMLSEIANKGEDRSLQRQAISALGEIKEDSSAEVLAEVADTVDGRTRFAVIRALGSVGTESANITLEEMVTSEENMWTRIMAGRALAESGNADSAYRLVPTLSNQEDSNKLMAAANVIAQINSKTQDPVLTGKLEEVVPQLQEAIENNEGSPREKWMAFATLAAIGTEETNELILSAAEGTEDNASDEIQRTALWTASQSGNPGLASGLSEILRTSEEEQRQVELASAIAAIAARNPDSEAAGVSSREAMPVLMNLAASGQDRDIQRRAIRSIGWTGTSADVDFLNRIGNSSEDLKNDVKNAVDNITRREAGEEPRFGGRFFR